MGRVQRCTVGLRGEKRSLEDQERVSDGTQGGVMMESSPGAPFEVIEADLAFEVLVVSLDPPAPLHEPHQLAKRGTLRQRAEPELAGPLLPCGPLAQQPLFGPGRTTLAVVVRASHADRREA